MKHLDVEWTDSIPTKPGMYFVWEADRGTRLEGVYQRPGHTYLCIQEEPRGFATKREFRAVSKMRTAKWAGPYRMPIP